eukprot:COSAG06_NODE_271_length_18677_cov_157.113360_13_plen_179_part_00
MRLLGRCSRMALQALHVAYAYQSLGNTSSKDQHRNEEGLSGEVEVLPPGAAKVQLPYDGFADGPLLLNVTRTSDTGLTLTYTNAVGLSLKPTYECGVGGYNGSGCCEYDRNWETSAASEGDDDSLWTGVPASKVKLIAPLQGQEGTGHVVLTVTDATGVKRLRSNSQMYPQCVLTNGA